MNWLKAIGSGIALFAIMFVIGSIVMFGLNLSGTAISIIMLISVIIVAWLLAKQYKISSFNDGIIVGLVLLLVNALLEYIVIIKIMQLFNSSNYYTWSVLLSYLLIVVIPALVGRQNV